MDELHRLVVIFLGITAILSIIGIVILRINRIDAECALSTTAGTCLGALTGILVHPPKKSQEDEHPKKLQL